ncbi:SNF2-related protein [Mycoplasma mycoides]|uniref:SNF2-related protein n=1 Tax=Mycoplasma mycoides TaxID=2102 RepID=UPI00223F08CA|nr:SNF2-related protein [Mycoplasma mycoides]QVK03073.1 DEAD/DEAH box helicase [Mycoplasma mycoides subsp. capri]QVK03889.1 DEAD/DEAH box helicase [Mycoplasma mycoides subsp. capri]
MAIIDQLFDWQKELIIKNKHKNQLGLFLDMGSGKTILSLGFCEINQVDAIIVIASRSKTLETVEQNASFTNYLQNDLNFKVYLKTDLKNADFKNNQKEAIIINYHSFLLNINKENFFNYLAKFVSIHKNQKIAIIIDESQNIKNSRALISISIKNFVDLVKKLAFKTYLYLLSGTPQTTGAIDMFNQLRFLGLKMTRYQFEDQFCIKTQFSNAYRRVYKINGYKNIKQLEQLINQFALTSKNIPPIYLPKQQFIGIKLPISSEFELFTNKKITEYDLLTFCNKNNIKSNYKPNHLNLIKNPYYKNLSYPDDKWIAGDDATFWLRTRQISIGFQGNSKDYYWFDYSRLNKLEQLLTDKIDNYIIFYNYDPEFDEIYKICKKLDYKIDILNGNKKDITNYLEYLNLDIKDKPNSKKRVIIANYFSASTGNNWQEYDKTILFSLATYGYHIQALKRNHRIGTKNTITYYLFLQDNYLDKSMWDSIQKRQIYNTEIFIKSTKEFNKLKSQYKNLTFNF